MSRAQPSLLFRRFLPKPATILLFGDRERYGRRIVPDDAEWMRFQELYLDFFETTQKKGLGQIVNEAGYAILDRVDLAGRRVLEIGGGRLPHMPRWRGKPAGYSLVDINRTLLEDAAGKLAAAGITGDWTLRRGDDHVLPYPDATFDVVVVFYVLEHLHPLADHLTEMVRVLRPGGVLVGGIPTEGGLAWGLGRLATSQRWLRRRGIDPKKTICWEHPNFADEVLGALSADLVREQVVWWPFGLPLLDLNLIVGFRYRKEAPQR